MNLSIPAILTWTLGISTGAQGALAAPIEPCAPSPLVQAADQAYPGQIRLMVDASHPAGGIVHVRETITGAGTDCVLLHARQASGWDAPIGTRGHDMAGLMISANGTRLAWARDPVDADAFRVKVPPGSGALDLQFDHVSHANPETGWSAPNRDTLILEWTEVVLYPAGYFTGRIPVDATVTLPVGWAFATPLQTAASAGTRTDFQRVSLQSLMESPVYAGRHWARNDLGARAPAVLNLFTDGRTPPDVQPDDLERSCCP
jgi:hypothetical protein